ncbi:hypothetical protein Scep_018622 [Stephania cephalantha]|uniref:SAP domain-containing protein n=1 Tax=Stephania cephalantha TaxID=152367 RepID=A0AAP0I9E7_9MAGN
MSTQYPVLGNRPIDQWKVTELKDELKRRKLATRGLKDDLIKRLDEALRNERMEEEESELQKSDDTTDQEEIVDGGTALDNDGESVHDQEKVEEEKETIHVEKDFQKEEPDDGPGIGLDQEAKCDDVVTSPMETDTAEDTGDHHQNGEGDVDEKTEVVNIDDSPAPIQSKNEEADITNANESAAVAGEAEVIVTSVETNVTITQSLVTEVSSSSQLLSNKTQVENGDPKPAIEDAAPEVASSNNQVSEVSPVLGSQIRSESISNESVSINEKIELKDNLNADNVHLEIDVTVPEMVQPSSSAVPSEGGDVHPLDGPEPPENQSSVEEMNDINASNVDIQKNSHGAESGSPEKLNLDRSSGDDSMEEDVVEKHIDSTHNSDEVEDKNKDGDVKEETLVDVVEDGQKDVPAVNKSHLAAAADKRKADVQEVAGNHEQPPKRQRRWNSENLKIPETKPKETFPPVSRSTFTRSNSTLSGGDTPKERVVPPSPKSPTNSLRIDNFLRPFTLKAVQELLGKTGSVSNFWMDHIKTHCYVTYSSVEEAIGTRNALYNLQWPSNGGKLLAAEFVDQQEVKMRVEASSQQPAAPVSTGPSAHPTQPPSQSQPASRQQVPKQPLPPAPPLPSPKQKPNQTSAKDRLNLPPPPPLTKKPDPPIVTLDDLFRKTKAAPRIYYLPLSDEQVGTKLAAQGRNNN